MKQFGFKLEVPRNQPIQKLIDNVEYLIKQRKPDDQLSDYHIDGYYDSETNKDIIFIYNFT